MHVWFHAIDKNPTRLLLLLFVQKFHFHFFFVRSFHCSFHIQLNLFEKHFHTQKLNIEILVNNANASAHHRTTIDWRCANWTIYGMLHVSDLALQMKTKRKCSVTLNQRPCSHPASINCILDGNSIAYWSFQLHKSKKMMLISTWKCQ